MASYADNVHKESKNHSIKQKTIISPKSECSFVEQAISMEKKLDIKDETRKYKKLKLAFFCAMKVIKNYIGVPVEPLTVSPQDLYSYTLNIFENLPEDVKTEIESKALKSANQIRRFQLDLTIISAKIIYPVFSRKVYLFCKMWINKYHAHFTTAKSPENALNFNETFKLNIHSYSEDIVKIELWITRIPEAVTTIGVKKIETSMWRRVKNFIFPKQDLNKDIYFIGTYSERIMNLPCIKIMKTVKLANPKKRKKKIINLNAEIEIGMNVIAKRRKHVGSYIQKHILLLNLCYQKHFDHKKCFKSWKNWLQILPSPAVTLIHQHAIQNAMTITEQTFCFWIVSFTLKKHEEHRIISYFLIRQLLEEIISNTLNENRTDEFCMAYQKAATKFSAFAAQQLSKLHVIFSWETEEEANELHEFLACVAIIEANTEDTTYKQYFSILSDEYKTNFSEAFRDNKGELKDDVPNNVNIDALKSVLSKLIEDQIYLDDIFQRSWGISYLSIIYEDLDNAMVTFVKPIILCLQEKLQKKSKKNDAINLLMLLQVYHYIRNLVEYIIKKLPEKKFKLKMEEYPSWFNEKLVASWFIMSKDQTKVYIIKAVENDIMEPINKNSKYGTSVPDVSDIIHEMVIETWKNLEWTFQLNTLNLLYKAITHCAVNYFEAIAKRCHMAHYFCSEENFYITQKLCVALSNNYAIYQYLNQMFENIRNILNEAEQENNFAIIESSDEFKENMLKEMSLMFLKVVSKFEGEMYELIGDMLKITQKREQRRSVQILCEYCTQALEIMFFNLMLEPFLIMLRSFWIAILTALYYKVTHYPFIFCGTENHIYVTADQALENLGRVFHCKGNGLSYFEMENKKYRELKQYLLRSMPTIE